MNYEYFFKCVVPSLKEKMCGNWHDDYKYKQSIAVREKERAKAENSITHRKAHRVHSFIQTFPPFFSSAIKPFLSYFPVSFQSRLSLSFIAFNFPVPMNRHNLFFKTPILAPSSSPENRRLRIADILTDDEEDHAGYGTLGDDDDGMSGVGERRLRERSPSLHCSSPWRIIARCFAALRPARERRISVLRREKREELGEVSGHTTRLMNALNSRDSPVSGSESEDSGEVLELCSPY